MSRPFEFRGPYAELSPRADLARAAAQTRVLDAEPTLLRDVHLTADSRAIWVLSRGHCSNCIGADVSHLPTGPRLTLLDVHSGRVLRRHRLPLDHARSLVVTRDGRRAYVGGSQHATKAGLLLVFDLIQGREIARWPGHTRCINSLRMTPDERRLVTGSEDRLVCVWDARDGTLLHTFQGHKKDLEFVDVSPDGRTVLATSAEMILRWDLPRGEETGRWAPQKPALGALLIPNRDWLVIGHKTGTILVWDIKGKREVVEWRAHRDAVEAMTLLADGRRLLTGGSEGVVSLWSLEDGRLLWSQVAHDKGVSAVSISANSDLVLTGSMNGKVRMWTLPLKSKS